MITLLFIFLLIVLIILVILFVVAPLIGGGLGIILGLLEEACANGASSLKSKRLSANFRKVGNPIGLSDQEIIKVVGRPAKVEMCMINEAGNVEYIYTWDSKKYAVLLVFNQDKKCIRIEDEIIQ